MKKIFITAASLAMLSATTAIASEPNQEAENEKSCSVVYQGETSRLQFCDNGSVDWTLPKDALRIGEPFKPGPGAIVREIPEKVIVKPLNWVGDRLGIKW